MRVTYHNAGPNKGAEIELGTGEALLLNRLARGPGGIAPSSEAARDFMCELLPKLDRAILHGDSEAEEGGG